MALSDSLSQEDLSISGKVIELSTLTNGAADARPLWVFCATSQPSGHVANADCRVPMLSRLAIGHIFITMDEAFAETEWSALTWELSIDDQAIDLDGFGTYDYLLPAMAPNPSLVREEFIKFTAWDVVLTALEPGAHTLHGSVRDETEVYSWS